MRAKVASFVLWISVSLQMRRMVEVIMMLKEMRIVRRGESCLIG